MLKLAICVKSCQVDKLKGCHQAIRETWGASLPDGVDLLFFMGGNRASVNLEVDERHLDVDDGYWTSTPKMLAIVKYAVWKDYDFAMLCDTDTYIDVPALMRSGFENYDYSGVLSGGRAVHGKPEWVFGEAREGRLSDHERVLVNPSYSYMSGGHGYIISRNAAKVVASLKAPVQEGEDMMVGWVLGPFLQYELKAANLPNFKNVVVFHLDCGYYGGGHEKRLDASTAVRRKHKEMT